MEEVLAAVAQAMNAPVAMVERSAAARAEAGGVPIEDVLRAWSGGGAVAAAAPAAEPEAAPAVVSDAPVVAPPVVSAPAPAAAVDEASIIAAAAEKMGMPESMVRRSAAARAKAQGVDVDAVLMEWAGTGGAAPAAAAVVSAPVPAAAVVSAPVPAAAAPPDVPESQDDAPPPAPTPAPEPLESMEEAAAAGALPRWLAALFVFVPAFAIAYALFLPNGPSCGDAGSLAVDPVTGLAVNCDGSAFGSEVVDLFSLGADTYTGAGCTACHGPNGGGVATFPALTGGALLSSFPPDSCSVQIEWISLGTVGWPDSTYGADAKPVGGSGAVMPGFAASLSAEELAAVAVYERVAFGGQDLAAAEIDCGAVAEGDSAALGE